jgi:hypothetical protein
MKFVFLITIKKYRKQTDGRYTDPVNKHALLPFALADDVGHDIDLVYDVTVARKEMVTSNRIVSMKRIDVDDILEMKVYGEWFRAQAVSHIDSFTIKKSKLGDIYVTSNDSSSRTLNATLAYLHLACDLSKPSSTRTAPPASETEMLRSIFWIALGYLRVSVSLNCCLISELLGAARPD